MTYPFTLGYECLLSLMWQCLNNCCDENCCLITPTDVATPWALLFIVFSHSCFFRFFSLPLCFFIFFALIQGDFVCIQIFRLLCVFLSHSFLLHLLCKKFLHFHFHLVFFSYLVAMDDEAMEVFVLSCLLLLIQMV